VIEFQLGVIKVNWEEKKEEKKKVFCGEGLVMANRQTGPTLRILNKNPPTCRVHTPTAPAAQQPNCYIQQVSMVSSYAHLLFK
jgi:hypothetical protein